MSYENWQSKAADFRKSDVRGIQGNFFQGLKKQATIDLCLYHIQKLYVHI